MTRFRRLCTFVVACAFAGLISPGLARGQEESVIPIPPGQRLFEKHCTTCHGNPAMEDRAPDLKALVRLTPEAVYTAVTSGSMNIPAQSLTDDEKRLVAEYLGGRPLELTDSAGAKAMPNRCAGNPPLGDPSASASWNGWGVDVANARFEAARSAGLTAEQVPHLKLKWAFGFPRGGTAYGQPSIVAGRIFVGSDNGYVYSLDASSGCVYWSYLAKSGVRTAPSVGPVWGHRPTRYAVYFGDMHGNAYAVDAATGRQLWAKQVGNHYTARITGSPTLYRGRVYVPTSSSEEVFGPNPSYPCCTFRGSVVALDANTGRELWRTYLIPEEPKPTKKNSRGVQLWAPSGAAVWNSPTIDPSRQALYIGTGNSYTEPAAKTTDAIVALDLNSGKFLWTYQTLANDAFLVGCVDGGKNENCPRKVGPDLDVGASAILLNLSKGRRLLLATPKNGEVLALDPDRKGALVWKVGLAETPPPNNGEIAFGGAADSDAIYVPLEDGTFAAIELSSGHILWRTRLESLDDLGQPSSNGENRTKGGLRFGQSAAATLIPGAVFTGGWDGILRALSTADGKLLWQFNTAQEFTTVNKVAARGGSMGGPGATVVNGMLYVGSGYANVGSGMPGNVLLAFAVESDEGRGGK
jgi:polyvinyl alcohol dehydrogenase (cytochrome)